MTARPHAARRSRGSRAAVVFTPLLPVLAAMASLVASCGVRTKRDLNVPPREITYSDACGLQEYFDQRTAANLVAPAAADETIATNAKGQTIGEGTYLLKDPLARRRFGRLLRDEYDGIESKIVHAVEGSDGVVRVHVRWWDAGSIRRLREEDDVIIETPAGTVELPPNVCVSDLLFGEKVYAMRARYLRNEVDLATGHTSSASIDALVSSVGPTPSAPAPATTSAAPPATTSAAPPATTTGDAGAPSPSTPAPK